MTYQPKYRSFACNDADAVATILVDTLEFQKSNGVAFLYPLMPITSAQLSLFDPVETTCARLANQRLAARIDATITVINGRMNISASDIADSMVLTGSQFSEPMRVIGKPTPGDVSVIPKLVGTDRSAQA